MPNEIKGGKKSEQHHGENMEMAYKMVPGMESLPEGIK